MTTEAPPPRENEVDLPRDDLGERLLHRLVRHMHHARAGHLLEEFAAEMERGAIARRAECELVRIGLRVAHEFRYRLCRQRISDCKQILP